MLGAFGLQIRMGAVGKKINPEGIKVTYANSDLQSEFQSRGFAIRHITHIFIAKNFMGQKKHIIPNKAYYLTLTVTDWVDVFSRPIYRHILIDSIKHCINEKGLILHAWCLMSNHLHLLANGEEDVWISAVLRDMKKFTSKQITKAITEVPESRRDWMLDRFAFAGKHDPKIKNYKFWRDGNEPKEVFSHPFMMQKLNYIHQNPVRAEYVAEPHHYLYSSAIDYAGGKGLLPVVLVM